jgi:hypothetical protein
MVEDQSPQSSILNTSAATIVADLYLLVVALVVAVVAVVASAVE